MCLDVWEENLKLATRVAYNAVGTRLTSRHQILTLVTVDTLGLVSLDELGALRDESANCGVLFGHFRRAHLILVFFVFEADNSRQLLVF